MKYLKRFESVNDTFIIDDIVVILRENHGYQKFNDTTGRIIKYHSGSRNDYDVKFNGYEELYWFRYDEIRFATNEEIEEFEMIENANKYNL